ncbi:Granulocyte colony stimulating factor 1 isoform 2 [Scophthalmus maximus]|uniref:Granulocyte colony stimulating factor 1 isoform 2 n=1 Tax=Scophthalmus maximus TaxID=52904 RepID=A0A2U9CP10_SCOMX|nr:Granulocyte colony stimulating factor 1 isoform 2 [Scophthalmus maximus]
MNILIVFALPCYMATLGRGAPLPGRSALVEEPRFQELVQKSRSLTEKILGSVPAAHESCVRTESFKLNSSENAHLAIMAANIGILPAPVLRAVSENVISKTILTRISEGLQLHRALLSTISGRLQNKDQVTELMADIRDLDIQINKMLKMVQEEAVVLPTQPTVTLRLPGEYEVQLAAHLTLEQLLSFGQDTVRYLRSLDKSNEEETESWPTGVTL